MDIVKVTEIEVHTMYLWCKMTQVFKCKQSIHWTIIHRDLCDQPNVTIKSFLFFNLYKTVPKIVYRWVKLNVLKPQVSVSVLSSQNYQLKSKNHVTRLFQTHSGRKRTLQRHFFRSLVNKRLSLLQDFMHLSDNRDINYKTKRLASFIQVLNLAKDSGFMNWQIQISWFSMLWYVNN